MPEKNPLSELVSAQQNLSEIPSFENWSALFNSFNHLATSNPNAFAEARADILSYIWEFSWSAIFKGGAADFLQALDILPQYPDLPVWYNFDAHRVVASNLITAHEAFRTGNQFAIKEVWLQNLNFLVLLLNAPELTNNNRYALKQAVIVGLSEYIAKYMRQGFYDLAHELFSSLYNWRELNTGNLISESAIRKAQESAASAFEQVMSPLFIRQFGSPQPHILRPLILMMSREAQELNQGLIAPYWQAAVLSEADNLVSIGYDHRPSRKNLVESMLKNLRWGERLGLITDREEILRKITEVGINDINYYTTAYDPLAAFRRIEILNSYKLLNEEQGQTFEEDLLVRIPDFAEHHIAMGNFDYFREFITTIRTRDLTNSNIESQIQQRVLEGIKMNIEIRVVGSRSDLAAEFINALEDGFGVYADEYLPEDIYHKIMSDTTVFALTLIHELLKLSNNRLGLIQLIDGLLEYENVLLLPASRTELHQIQAELIKNSNIN